MGCYKLDLGGESISESLKYEDRSSARLIYLIPDAVAARYDEQSIPALAD
jgi:hypothetical protein